MDLFLRFAWLLADRFRLFAEKSSGAATTSYCREGKKVEGKVCRKQQWRGWWPIKSSIDSSKWSFTIFNSYIPRVFYWGIICYMRTYIPINVLLSSRHTVHGGRLLVTGWDLLISRALAVRTGSTYYAKGRKRVREGHWVLFRSKRSNEFVVSYVVHPEYK